MNRFTMKLMFKSFRQTISLVLIVAFSNLSLYIPKVHAGEMVMPVMPTPGTMVNLSPAYLPALLQGITIRPDNALQFDFLVHKGEGQLDESQKKVEYNKLVKYFLASLTIPDQDQWVNLSPYEQNRIIEDNFGKTEMGRDLLGQDYFLKQITSSLMYPESGLGKAFWDKVYKRAYQEYGTTNIPVNTFNKVWIVPDQAIVYESGNTAYILKSHLKVMLEEDYLAREVSSRGGEAAVAISQKIASPAARNDTHSVASKVIREIILPELQREVNEGKNFAQLRQIYSGMVLATWYKKALKESLLGKVYANKAKVKGVDQDPRSNEKIYQQYLAAFKKGAYNYIKEEFDQNTNQTIPRKYFAGGFGAHNEAMLTRITPGKALTAALAGIVSSVLPYLQSSVAIAEINTVTVDITPQLSASRAEYTVESQLVRNITAGLRAKFGDQANKITIASNDPGILQVSFPASDSSGANDTKVKAQVNEIIARKGLQNEVQATVVRVNPDNVSINFQISDAAMRSRQSSLMLPLLFTNLIVVVSVAALLLGVAFVALERMEASDHGLIERLRDGSFARIVGHLDTSPSFSKMPSRLMDFLRADAENISQNPTALQAIVDYEIAYGEDTTDNMMNLRDLYLSAKNPAIQNAFLDIMIGLREGRGLIRAPMQDFLSNVPDRPLTEEEKSSISAALLKRQNMVQALERAYPPRQQEGSPLADPSPGNVRLVTGAQIPVEEAQNLFMKLLEVRQSPMRRDMEMIAYFLRIGAGPADRVNVALKTFQGTDFVGADGVLTRAAQEMILAFYFGINSIGETLVPASPDHDPVTGQLFSDPTTSPLYKKAEADQALVTTKSTPEERLGGIDMNAANLAMVIKRDGKGVPLPLAQQDMAQLSTILGFVPFIREIRTTTVVPILSELQKKLDSSHPALAAAS